MTEIVSLIVVNSAGGSRRGDAEFGVPVANCCVVMMPCCVA